MLILSRINEIGTHCPKDRFNNKCQQRIILITECIYIVPLHFCASQYGMSRRALRNSVPDKPFEEVWDYTLRFLGSSEELEENTTYTNADGVDLILPAQESYALPANADKRGVGGNIGSGGSGGAPNEDFIVEAGNKFFER